MKAKLWTRCLRWRRERSAIDLQQFAFLRHGEEMCSMIYSAVFACELIMHTWVKITQPWGPLPFQKICIEKYNVTCSLRNLAFFMQGLWKTWATAGRKMTIYHIHKSWLHSALISEIIIKIQRDNWKEQIKIPVFKNQSLHALIAKQEPYNKNEQNVEKKEVLKSWTINNVAQNWNILHCFLEKCIRYTGMYFCICLPGPTLHETTINLQCITLSIGKQFAVK